MPTIMGFDPGRDRSFGAFAVLEQHQARRVHPHELPPEDRRSLAEVLATPPTTYTLRYLHRFARDLSHPEMVNRVVEMWQHPDLPTPKTLLIDATSLGGHVVLDLFKLARVRPQPVVWHGGLSSTQVDGEWHVSKGRMVGALLTLVETQRLRMNPTMAFAEAMLEEMRQYVREQSPTTGREVFHAPATGAYDDLISATVMGAWWGERHRGVEAREIPLRI
jgi:hypothetical protein